MEKILEAIKINPAITYEELRKVTGLSTRGVEWNIKKLKAEAKIKRIGPDKDEHWEVTDES